jgi:N6-adenosine-specific RNA methylase IME4
MNELVLYEAARSALAAAVSVDEVKNIRDRALAMQILAKQARDSELIDKATELRLRAERRLGEMIIAQKETIGLAQGAAGIGKPASAVPEKYRTQPPTLASAGIDKKLSASAQKIAAMPAPAFEAHLVASQKQASDALRMTTVEKQARRAEREKELGERQLAWPTQVYGVIYADPEWRDEVWSRETGLDRAPDNHYSTSAPDVIMSRPVASLAADDCVLFLWSTIQHEAIAHDVMKAWGFEYKSQIIWKKPSIGLGRWVRSLHEILLIGTRGEPVCPAPGEQWDSVIEAPRGVHSEKPEIFSELIESYFPTPPKIELNARRRRPGWDAWGLEAPGDEAAA